MTSTLLVFHERRSEVVLCVLVKYDDSIFLNCVETDVLYTGAQCVSAAPEECFARLGLTNDLGREPHLAADRGSSSDAASAVGELLL